MRQLIQIEVNGRERELAVKGVLTAHDDPSEAEIRDYLGGNLCRCGTYSAVIAAVQQVVAQVHASTATV
jgi:aerobic-type carbon monoxide dehydrogenase small subunit (CoxS/CutS family)